MTNNSAAQTSLQTRTARNSYMDVFKGLAILSMVLAHCGFPFTGEIYLFHMAAFFMAAGYFYNPKNTATLISTGKYIGKKILALYVPYVLFNGTLILLHNQLISWNLMTSDPLFEEIGGFGAVWGRQWPYTPELTKDSLKLVFQFQKEPQLAGATWFLRSLFVVSVFHCILMYLVQKLHFPWLKKLAIALFLIGSALGATAIQKGTLVLSADHAGYFAGWLAYMLGVFLRKKESLLRYDLPSALFAGFALFVMGKYGSISLASGHIQSVSFYLAASLFGWILLRSLAELLSGPVSRILAFAGAHSLSIVLWHFISFKIVTLARILLRSRNMILLASFPTMDGQFPYLWVAYTLAGMAIPLGIAWVYQKIKNTIVSFMRGAYESIRNRCRRSAGPRCGQ